MAQLPCDGRYGVLEGVARGEEDLPLHVLKVGVGGGFLRSKERGVR